MSEEFATRNAPIIKKLWSEVAKPYNVTEHEFLGRLAAVMANITAKNSSPRTTELDSSPHIPEDDHQQLATIKAGELCLAIACEKGDEAAWRDFEATYRTPMIAAARVLTKDDAEAEELVQFVYGELYGIRQDGQRRLSKLAHYSGRGSFGGWLRAVVYQCFIDRRRVTARFEQVEEVDEFDRLSQAPSAQGHPGLASRPPRPDQLEDRRLREATETALARALSLIDSRERLLLNYYYFDQLKLREIARIMGVHEATISRWVTRAEREVRRKTEDILRREFGFNRAQIAECLELAARSEVDVRDLLRDVKGPSAERAP
ncbi:MAG: sigma-70 family RNA polymerase sigma factor [Acidobacteria bacterium]|nr:sigma-70 family RNA polymerase sigma factor [Acidobacteriota bacterium]